MSNRWVAIDPDILTHPIVGAAQPVPPADKARGSYSRMEAWVWLICNASFADHTVYNRGRKMTLQRGDLLGGWAFLAHTWNWSVKSVRVWVEKLIADNMLRKRAETLQTLLMEHNGVGEKQGMQDGNYYGNQAQILSVVNYWRFQFEGYEQGQPIGQPEGQAKGNQRATKGQHITRVTREQGKQEEKDDNAHARETGSSKSFWARTLNAATDADVQFENGKLELLNGLKSEWVEKLGSEGRLSLALKEIAPRMQPCSPTPLRAQLESQLARIAGEKTDRDERYASAAKQNKKPEKPFKPSRW